MEYAIEAVFTENTTTYSVTYDASGGGTITAEGHEASPATVTYGQSLTFTAVPAEYGYVKEWRVDGVPVPNSSNKTSYTLENVTQAHTVTVVFATAVRYDVSYAVNGDGGTLSAAADGTELALSAGQQASVAGGSRLVFAAVPSSGMMTGHWTVNDIAVTRENMSSLGVTMDHCLSNTLTIESLSRNVEVKAAFAEYSGFSIPTGGPGYEISDVKRLPADTLPDTEIRAGGDVTFTVRPTAEYSDFSKLTVNGYDCLTGSGKAADCETVSARKNADGSYMQVDWAGDTAAVIDTDTGEIIPAYVFVATLPYSGYSYVEAFFSMNQESWTTAHVNAYKYFGGVTRIIQCDNLKTGVQKHGKDEVVLNKSYQELAEHYGTAILPARVRTPKDKAAVEGTVGIISAFILAALRNRQFLSLLELNEAIWDRLEMFNHKPFQKREGSRASSFAEERPFLRPLPPRPFELATWKVATVGPNYHISVERMNYSVPFEYIKQKVDVRLTKATVEVFYGGNRICSHPRLYGRFNQYSTIQEHMPPEHQKYVQWNGERFIHWAGKVGSNTQVAVQAILSGYKVEQQGYKSCMGLLKLADKYTPERLENACKRALEYTPRPSLKNIQAILASGQDKAIPEQSAATASSSRYGFTRGAAYYGRGNK